MIPPIKRKKVSEQILEELKRLIKEKTFPPNSKLPSENELAQAFGVSRSPVREALRVLEASGLIESKQGGGNFVKEVHLAHLLEDVTFELIDIEQVYHLLEMRTIIETEAAALAAVRHTAEELKRIELALDSFQQTVQDETSVGHEADFLLHHEIVKASHNPFLIQSLENLKDLYGKSLKFSLKQNVGLKRKREQVFQEHYHIYQAIKNRDERGAAYHMKRHLINARIKIGDQRVTPLD